MKSLENVLTCKIVTSCETCEGLHLSLYGQEYLQLNILHIYKKGPRPFLDIVQKLMGDMMYFIVCFVPIFDALWVEIKGGHLRHAHVQHVYGIVEVMNCFIHCYYNMHFFLVYLFII